MNEIEPCKYCGKKVVLLIEDIRSANKYGPDLKQRSRMSPHSHWKVKCNNFTGCKMMPQTPDVHTKEEAIEIWNSGSRLK